MSCKRLAIHQLRDVQYQSESVEIRSLKRKLNNNIKS